MKSNYNTETEEFTFNFLMGINGITYKVEAVACQDDILKNDSCQPEYIDVYMAKLVNEQTNELTESNIYKNTELLDVVSKKITERLITNARKTWFMTDAPRIFREQFDTCLEIMLQK